MEKDAKILSGQEYSWPHVEASVIIQTVVTFLQAVIQNDIETRDPITQKLGTDTEEAARLISSVCSTFCWAQEQERKWQAGTAMEVS